LNVIFVFLFIFYIYNDILFFLRVFVYFYC